MIVERIAQTRDSSRRRLLVLAPSGFSRARIWYTPIREPRKTPFELPSRYPLSASARPSRIRRAARRSGGGRSCSQRALWPRRSSATRRTSSRRWCRQAPTALPQPSPGLRPWRARAVGVLLPSEPWLNGSPRMARPFAFEIRGCADAGRSAMPRRPDGDLPAHNLPTRWIEVEAVGSTDHASARNGGEGGIRTPGTLAGTPDFESEYWRFRLVARTRAHVRRASISPMRARS